LRLSPTLLLAVCVNPKMQDELPAQIWAHPATLRHFCITP
jgi:hypothetical protein